jgi:hypothetical protein
VDHQAQGGAGRLTRAGAHPRMHGDADAQGRSRTQGALRRSRAARDRGLAHDRRVPGPRALLVVAARGPARRAHRSPDPGLRRRRSGRRGEPAEAPRRHRRPLAPARRRPPHGGFHGGYRARGGAGRRVPSCGRHGGARERRHADARARGDACAVPRGRDPGRVQLLRPRVRLRPSGDRMLRASAPNEVADALPAVGRPGPAAGIRQGGLPGAGSCGGGA